MNSRDNMYIAHILKHCDELIENLSEIKNNYDEFLENKNIKKAITFDIFQIGEMIGCLSVDIKKHFDPEDIRGAKNIRNCIAHGYAFIEDAELWKTANHDIPKISSILKDLVESWFNLKEKHLKEMP